MKALAIFTAGLAIGLALFVSVWLAGFLAVAAYGLRDAV